MSIGLPRLLCYSFQINHRRRQSSGQSPKARTFAAIVIDGVQSLVNLSELPAFTVRGDVIYFKISEDIYRGQLRSFRTKTESFKSVLASLWKLHNPW